MQKQITADNMARTIAFDWRYYEELIGCEDVERFASQMMKLAESDAKKEDFIDQILSKLDELSEAFRSEIRCACFCEDGCSPLMWAHYAADEGGGLRSVMSLIWKSYRAVARTAAMNAC